MMAGETLAAPGLGISKVDNLTLLEF